MQVFIEWLEEKFVPVAQKIGSQRHLVAVRDGFIALMPLVIAGSLAVLLNNVIFAPWSLLADWFNSGDTALWEFFGKYFQPVMGNIWWGTFAILALVLTFTIGYSLGKSYDVNPLSTAVVTLAGYVALTPQGVEGTWGNIGWQYTNFGALLPAVIIALVVAQVFTMLMRANITIKLPDNVPPAVGKAFAAIIPGVIAITIGGFVPVFFGFFGDVTVFEFFWKITDPLLEAGQNVFFAMFYVLLIGFFWFFGLHGGNMMGAVTSAVYLPSLGENQLAAEAGEALPHVFTPAFFDSFVHLGGAGASLALLVVIFIASKRKDYREVSKIAVGGSIFQINEPVMYGLPVVLNPILLIPFLIIPVILTFNAWFFTAVIPLAGRTYVAIPWVTPPVLGAFLSTGGSFGAALVALMNFAIACVIYYPFVLLSNKEVDAE